MQPKVETTPAKKEEVSQQMMPEIPYDPQAGKKPIQQALPENPDKPPEWERKPKHDY